MGIINDDFIPVGLGMALAKNIDAMKNFTNLTEAEREEVLNQARDARTKQDMEAIVSNLSDGRVF